LAGLTSVFFLACPFFENATLKMQQK